MSEDKVQVLNLIIKDIFKGVTSDEILEIEYAITPAGKFPKALRIGESLLPVSDIVQVKQEAQYLQESYLWKLMVKRIQYIAQLNACNRAKSDEDLIFGKAMLYSIEQIEDVLKTIREFEVQKVEKKEKVKKENG